VFCKSYLERLLEENVDSIGEFVEEERHGEREETDYLCEINSVAMGYSERKVLLLPWFLLSPIVLRFCARLCYCGEF
jgi:hypothetical protein